MLYGNVVFMTIVYAPETENKKSTSKWDESLRKYSTVSKDFAYSV